MKMPVDNLRPKPSILILYHCKSNTGYAIGTLEKAFWEAALRVTDEISDVHLSYTSYHSGLPYYVPDSFKNVIKFDPKSSKNDELRYFYDYLVRNNVKLIFGFDQPPNRPYYKLARKAGVKKIISYYGAPMSSINSGIKLVIKKIYNKIIKYGPDFYVFESLGMQRTATHGRGILESKTAICPIGIDTNKYCPDIQDIFYAHDLLGYSRNTKLIFYSGHFEERKGISVIMAAANRLAEERSDFAFVLCGNTAQQAEKFGSELTESAKEYVHFGGYREDLNRIHRSCYLGLIASVGWDSFTVSSIEMQSSGLPLVLSDLLGLREAIVDGQTGKHFEPGNHSQLASIISTLLDCPDEQARMAKNARERMLKEFSKETQIMRLTELFDKNLAKIE
ncbi:glycosyltransferase family 4 protein [Marinobacter sp.]|uniref:glycosyltransferase family 4 protein n=1 Tax=Marinobacter sp. TaxID=50741 RepID=UPI003564E932